MLDPVSPYYQAGAKAITLFGVAPYGIPNVIWGIIYIVYASPFLLTGGAGIKVFQKIGRTLKGGAAEGGANTAFEQGSDFWIGLLVAANSPAVGKSIEDAGLRHLDGVYLTSVRRNGKVIHAVGHDFVIAAGDVLYFSGVPDGIEAMAASHGLLPYSDSVEILDASDLPNLSAAFGVGSIAVPRSDSVNKIVDSSADADTTSTPSFELVEATIKKG